MTNFGKQLREFRHQCDDNKSPHGRLTQEKFGELVGQELGISYSGAAVSDWERGVSKIHADQRLVLISILRVLVQWGGNQHSHGSQSIIGSRKLSCFESG